jgi:hypothetical protein
MADLLTQPDWNSAVGALNNVPQAGPDATGGYSVMDPAVQATKKKKGPGWQGVVATGLNGFNRGSGNLLTQQQNPFSQFGAALGTYLRNRNNGEA